MTSLVGLPAAPGRAFSLFVDNEKLLIQIYAAEHAVCRAPLRKPVLSFHSS
jgi:hypothetical protein